MELLVSTPVKLAGTDAGQAAAVFRHRTGRCEHLPGAGGILVRGAFPRRARDLFIRGPVSHGRARRRLSDVRGGSKPGRASQVTFSSRCCRPPCCRVSPSRSSDDTGRSRRSPISSLAVLRDDPQGRFSQGQRAHRTSRRPCRCSGDLCTRSSPSWQRGRFARRWIS